MRKPFRWASKPDVSGEISSTISDPNSPVPQPSRLRVTLLVASSALLSGIAVVLWNRRSLERIREAAPSKPAPSSESREFI